MRSLLRSEPGERWARSDRGQATAETAVVLPSLVLLTVMLLWGLLAVGAHIQCVDAARAGARAAARAEPWPQVTEAARHVAPAGARIETRREGRYVHVRVTSGGIGPGKLAVQLSAEAVAQTERDGPYVLSSPSPSTPSPSTRSTPPRPAPSRAP